NSGAGGDVNEGLAGVELVVCVRVAGVEAADQHRGDLAVARGEVIERVARGAVIVGDNDGAFGERDVAGVRDQIGPSHRRTGRDVVLHVDVGLGERDVAVVGDQVGPSHDAAGRDVGDKLPVGVVVVVRECLVAAAGLFDQLDVRARRVAVVVDVGRDRAAAGDG